MASSKYAVIALSAAKKAREGIEPVDAWKESAAEVFPDSSESRNKACPKCAFLGLAEDGFVKGVPAGSYTTSKKNKRYALEGLKLLLSNPSLAGLPEDMWRLIMTGEEKQHNQQMDVVAGLWKNGDIDGAA
jgi:Family of unknown function (DUF6979)